MYLVFHVPTSQQSAHAVTLPKLSYIFSDVFRPAGVPCGLMLESPTIVLSVPTFNFVRLSTHARYERSYRPDDEAYCGNG